MTARQSHDASPRAGKSVKSSPGRGGVDPSERNRLRAAAKDAGDGKREIVGRTKGDPWRNENKAKTPGHRKQTQPEGKPGRNQPCDCGSKRKWKKCCGAPPKTLEERYAAYDTMDEYPTMTPGFFADDATPVEPAE